MSERVAIVAGAGGELGRATAEKLAAAGFTVAGVDRNQEALKELPDGIRREAADPTDPAAARSAVDRIAAEVGPPEVLVNTIGTYRLGEALTATPEDLRLMIDVNVGAALADSGGGPVPAGPRFGFGRARGRPPGPGAGRRDGRLRRQQGGPGPPHPRARPGAAPARDPGERRRAAATRHRQTHPYLTPEVLAHAVAPEAVADLIVCLVSEAAAPVSGAVVPAYGA
jgi:hypothetical protein